MYRVSNSLHVPVGDLCGSLVAASDSDSLYCPQDRNGDHVQTHITCKTLALAVFFVLDFRFCCSPYLLYGAFLFNVYYSNEHTQRIMHTRSQQIVDPRLGVAMPIINEHAQRIINACVYTYSWYVRAHLRRFEHRPRIVVHRSPIVSAESQRAAGTVSPKRDSRTTPRRSDRTSLGESLSR